MTRVYHRGELEIQQRAGASALAAELAGSILPGIAHKFIAFIETQPLLLLGAADPAGRVWASALFGEPGFIRVADEQTLHIVRLPGAEDPLGQALASEVDVGLLLIDFASGRRLRVNGRGQRQGQTLRVKTRQVYANCPRYIQARDWELTEATADQVAPGVERWSRLTPALRRWIGAADTFFVASHHPKSGADLSHRGGFPGFVRVLDDHSLTWPEYNGNGMFNTLGNIAGQPRSGLLFINFDQGGILQLTGSASIVEEAEQVTASPGAERLVVFNLEQALVSTSGGRLRWHFLNYSPDNPWFF